MTGLFSEQEITKYTEKQLFRIMFNRIEAVLNPILEKKNEGFIADEKRKLENIEISGIAEKD